MFLGSVKGHVVATTKDPAMQGRKLLIVEPLKVVSRGAEWMDAWDQIWPHD